MRFFCLAALVASACAFTLQPAAFTTQSPVVGERAFDNVVAPSTSHRNRRATIVMGGKANGEFLRSNSTGTHTHDDEKKIHHGQENHEHFMNTQAPMSDILRV
jgi:hypothetical protein